LDTVDETLKKWQGREEALFSALVEKYETPAKARRAAEIEFKEIANGLKNIYKENIKPIEELYKFDYFFSPFMEDVDFESKPMVLLLGQYSVGKSTFISHVIKRSYPGAHIGPEPTTDRFVAVMFDKQDQVIPGNALCVSADKPFRALNKFGASFLNRIEASLCNSKVLELMTLIDTPGVLSGEKQRIGRNYDFSAVIEWFASRVDRILLLFDAHKLDVSDEFKRTIEALKGHDDKIRVVLNKADSVSPKQLMRVYGALMWSLGKVVKTPEVLRVYIGSFWDKPVNPAHENAALFASEMADLMSDLESLPRNSAMRKVNDLIKRARLAKVHAYIIAELKSQMPAFWGKSSKQKEILDKLPDEFAKIAAKVRLPVGDFPDVNRFRELLEGFDLSKFPTLNEKYIRNIDKVLSHDIPELLKKIKVPQEQKDLKNLFTFESEWVISRVEKAESDKMFYRASLSDGKLGGAAARTILTQTGIPVEELKRIWTLADIDRTNQLDADEFAIAMYLIRKFKGGASTPDTLPSNLFPPSKRYHES